MSEPNNLIYASPAALAFLGDAVYEEAVRRALLELDAVHSDALHKKAVPYVCAEGQALAIRTLLPTLSEEERTVVMRARNKKVSSQPRHADPVDYKWATGFEALIGYWRLKGEEEKLAAFIQNAMTLIREKKPEQPHRKPIRKNAPNGETDRQPGDERETAPLTEKRKPRERILVSGE